MALRADGGAEDDDVLCAPRCASQPQRRLQTPNAHNRPKRFRRTRERAVQDEHGAHGATGVVEEPLRLRHHVPAPQRSGAAMASVARVCAAWARASCGVRGHATAQRAAAAGAAAPCKRAAGCAARPGGCGGRGQARASAAPSAATASKRQHLRRRSPAPRPPRAGSRVPPLEANTRRTWGRFPAVCARLLRRQRPRRPRPPRWPRARCAASRPRRTRTGSRGQGRSTALRDAEQRTARQLRGAFEPNERGFGRGKENAPSSSASSAPARLSSLPMAAEGAIKRTCLSRNPPQAGLARVPHRPPPPAPGPFGA